MKKLYFFLIALCGIQAFSQIAITRDNTFGNNGNYTTSFSATQQILHSNTIILADHSILQIVTLADNNYILKLKPNGTLDTTFANNGKLELGVNNVMNAVLQNDKIIVYFGPKSVDYSDYTDSKIVRYNSNGTLDITFGTNGVLNEVTESTDPQALSVLVLKDQSLLITNSAETYPKKFTSNGQLDSAAGNNGIIQYNYHFPIGQFSNGEIATCDVSSTSSSLFSFFDLNSLSNNTVIDLNNHSGHQHNGFTIQNKNNVSTRTTKDGLVYSIFNYTNYPLPNFSRLIVMKNEQLDSQFNGAGFATSEDGENFLDAGFSNNLFIVLNEKGNQKALNAYSTAGISLNINNVRDFSLTSGHEIEMKDNYILIKSMLRDENQNVVNVKIEKLLISDGRLTTSNNPLKQIKVENPVKDFLNIINAENGVQFDLYDMNGRMILNSKSSKNINTSNISKGNYILKIIFKNGEMSSHKLLKN